jgi:hypothetical protein
MSDLVTSTGNRWHYLEGDTRSAVVSAVRAAPAAAVAPVAAVTAAVHRTLLGRGLRSSTSQLSLSRFRAQNTP